MKKYQSLYYAVIVLMLLLFDNSIASAQKMFKALPVNATTAETNALLKIFKRQTIVELDAKSIAQFIKQSGYKSNIVIETGNLYNWDINIEQHDLRSADYLAQRTTKNGVVDLKKEDCFTYAGFLKGSNSDYVRLNIQDEKLSGNIIYHGKSVYIEPLKKFITTAPSNKYVIYERGDSRPVKAFCNQNASVEQQVDQKIAALAAPAAADCRKIEIATESDWEDYLQGVTSADIIGNLNFVEPLYQNFFGAAIVVKYQHEWATPIDPYVTTNLCTGTERLQEFQTYWQNNFAWVKRDINLLYSGVEFSGSTIGCARTSSFQNSTGDECYAVVQWKTTYNDEGREVLVAHEMGHIFGCSHDDIGCSSDNGPIMCSNINASCTNNCTPYWSLASITSILNSMASSNGSTRFRTREFFQPISTSLLFGIVANISGNDLFVNSSNTVGAGLFGSGSITYTGTDNITLQPGFEAKISNGTGAFTARLGACDINSQLQSTPQTAPAEITQAVAKTIATGNVAIKMYPNPFKNATNLEIALPKAANVSVAVYDTHGKLIDNPVRNKPMPAGKNTIPYTNNKLAPNVYLFVIDVDGKKYMEKLIKL